MGNSRNCSGLQASLIEPIYQFDIFLSRETFGSDEATCVLLPRAPKHGVSRRSVESLKRDTFSRQKRFSPFCQARLTRRHGAKCSVLFRGLNFSELSQAFWGARHDVLVQPSARAQESPRAFRRPFQAPGSTPAQRRKRVPATDYSASRPLRRETLPGSGWTRGPPPARGLKALQQFRRNSACGASRRRRHMQRRKPLPLLLECVSSGILSRSGTQSRSAVIFALCNRGSGEMGTRKTSLTRMAAPRRDQKG